MKSGELAQRLGVSDASIRNWAEMYRELLSPRGAGVQPGAAREFNEADALVLASVGLLRAQGVTHDDIRQTLQEGWRVEALPELPSAEETAARREIGLVPVEAAERWKDRYELVAAQLLSLQERERDYLERIADLERQLGEASGERKGKDAMIDELRNQIEALRADLAEARRKRGLFGR